MAKSSGLGDGLIVDGVDLSGDTGGLQAIGKSRPTTGSTGIDKSAQERLHLRRDGRIDWSSHWNPANTGSELSAHEELSTLPTTDRIVTYLRGRALGNSSASLVSKQLNYDPTRNADGSMAIALQARGDGFGLEWGQQLTAGIDTLAAAGNGNGLDYGATIGTTAFGFQAYLQVVAFTGTDATVTIEHSDDDGSVDPYAAITGGSAFTQITTGPLAERIQSDTRTTSVKQWLRYAVTTTGGFSDLQFTVMVIKNTHEVLF